MINNLPVSRLINVAVILSPNAAQSQSLNSLLVLGSSDVIDVNERMRSYASLTAVAADFGISTPEYLSALLWFEQAPSPNALLIGRWAQSATRGKLIGAIVSAANQSMSVWNAITTGAFTVAIDGGAATNHGGLNFSSASNMNAVAGIITTALGGAATCIWNANYSRFEFESSTSGPASAISFLTAGTGVGAQDISALLGGLVSSGGYVANGIAAESALTAVTTFDNKFSQQWYAVTVLGAADGDHLAVAAFIQGTTTKHFYAVTTQESATLTPGDTSSLPAQLMAAGYSKTAVQYSSTNPYAAVSLMARILTTDFTGNNTAISLMYKQEPGIVPEILTVTQINALEAKNCNVFVQYNNNTAIIEPGVCSSGDFIDSVYGVDALSVDIMTAVYNLLYTSPTKVSQTDAGVHLLVTTIEQVLVQFDNDGLLGAGTWTGQGFGTLNTGDFLSKGFYVFANPLSSQSASDRAARKSPLIQVAAKLAGAIHTVDVQVSVNS